MNSKLDKFAVHVGLVQSSPKARFAHSLPLAKMAALDQQTGGETTESVKQEEFRRTSKIKALGAMIAAGSPRAQDRGEASGSITTNGVPIREASKTSNRSKRSRFPALFDEESADRLRHIQKALLVYPRGKRYKVWQFTESAHSSRAAFVYAGISKLIVVMSVLVSFLNASSIGLDWDVMELVFEMFFGLEFSLRLLCCPSQVIFML